MKRKNMISIQEPKDILAIAISNILSYRKDDKYYNLVNNWNKKIGLNIIELYPITIFFEGDSVRFEQGKLKKCNVILKTDLETLLDLAYGRVGAVSAVLKRRLKLKGLLKIGTLLKLMKIFFKPLKEVADNPNNNYYEQDKDIR